VFSKELGSLKVRRNDSKLDIKEFAQFANMVVLNNNYLQAISKYHKETSQKKSNY